MRFGHLTIATLLAISAYARSASAVPVVYCFSQSPLGDSHVCGVNLLACEQYCDDTYTSVDQGYLDSCYSSCQDSNNNCLSGATQTTSGAPVFCTEYDYDPDDEMNQFCQQNPYLCDNIIGDDGGGGIDPIQQ
jgi:hypothetical protein